MCPSAQTPKPVLRTERQSLERYFWKKKTFWVTVSVMTLRITHRVLRGKRVIVIKQCVVISYLHREIILYCRKIDEWCKVLDSMVRPSFDVVSQVIDITTTTKELKGYPSSFLRGLPKYLYYRPPRNHTSHQTPGWHKESTSLTTLLVRRNNGIVARLNQ